MNTDPARNESTSGKSFAHYLPHAARLFLGLIFFVFGLNGFLHFIPQPATMPENMTTFMAGLMITNYMFPLIFYTQFVVGVLLLTNRFVPLALALIAPVIVNIFAIHVFMERSGLPVAIVVSALEVYLAWSYRHAFRPMLAARVTPGDGH